MNFYQTEITKFLSKYDFFNKIDFSEFDTRQKVVKGAISVFIIKKIKELKMNEEEAKEFFSDSKYTEDEKDFARLVAEKTLKEKPPFALSHLAEIYKKFILTQTYFNDIEKELWKILDK